MNMTNEEVDFLNAGTEAFEAHKLGSSYSHIVTSYKCPKCKSSNLFADVQEVNEVRHTFEIDIHCLSCKRKKTIYL